jgi:hypothetical protein
MSLQTEHTDILIKVSTLLADGYSDEVSNLVTKLETKKSLVDMPAGLKSIYDEVKNTPIDEPELYKLSKEIQSQDKSIIDLVLKFLNEDDMDKYDINEISYFAGAVIRKINSLKDENGVFKATPNTMEWQRPKPSSIKKYESLLRSAQKIKRDDKKAQEEINKEIEQFLLKTSTLDESILTDWEKSLVIEQTAEALKGYLNSFLGKR